MSLLFQSGQSGAHRAASSSSHLLRWLVGLGGIGVFGVAIVDSSMIPLPLPGSTDLLLLILAVHPATAAIHVGSFVAAAAAGSIIGGYLTWETGRKGDLATLQKHVPAQLLVRVTGWVERHGPLAIAVAAVLPPPIPLMPILLPAGALGIPLLFAALLVFCFLVLLPQLLLSFQNFFVQESLAALAGNNALPRVGLVQSWRRSVDDGTVLIFLTQIAHRFFPPAQFDAARAGPDRQARIKAESFAANSNYFR